MVFPAGCIEGERITIAAVGDLLFHKKLQVQAYRPGATFAKFFQPLSGLLKAADLLYGNLEGPAARGVTAGGRAVRDPGRRLGRVYNAVLKSLSFNYHPSVIADLKTVGFDVISTANNHALDRAGLGVTRTIEELDRQGLAFTGTRAKNDRSRPWHVVTRARGFRVAWLACTFSANGFSDRKGQLLYCYRDRDRVLAEIRKLAADSAIDAVMLTPHWGAEGSRRPVKRQRDLARDAIEAGATAVIGTHPHTLQPWQQVVTRSGRTGLVVYSTGNFVSNQRHLLERAGIVVALELVKPAQRQGVPPGKARIAGAGFIPTWVEIDGRGHRVVPSPERGWPGQALKATMRLLPAGNRVKAQWPPRLPLNCPDR